MEGDFGTAGGGTVSSSVRRLRFRGGVSESRGRVEGDFGTAGGGAVSW